MTASESQLAKLILNTARGSLVEQHWPKIKDCVAPLTEEQVWWRPNQASNSIGNLLLHLNGNIGQWLVASFERRDDKRNRPQEFSARGAVTPADLLARLGATVEEAGRILARLTPEELLATYEIQGYTVTGLYAVFHAVEHFALHYGQIAYITKSLSGQDLGFHRELERTGRARSRA
jgi:uncharacterized damage-inducible protein DinB